ncbi:MAG: NAD(P)H-hydrate epimerase [Planctomycetota bacterium]|nr:NAD(P)H-hydrate epimerase [Planctomycetota bacterium]
MSSPENVILSREAVREIDRRAIEDFGIPGIVLMENAAIGLADAALKMLEGTTHDPSKVLIFCGSGNNGGDGYALARHLTNSGVMVTLFPLKYPRPGSDAAINALICRKMGIAESSLEHLEKAQEFDLVVDALFGTGLDRVVQGQSEDAISWINASGCPVLAVDVPSGLDCDTGLPLGPIVRAKTTVTFVASKPGFLKEEAKPYVGEIIVVEIGAPIT